MSSAVQEVGGYIPIHIDEGGYIYAIDEQHMRDFMVHRETRNMHRQPNCLALIPALTFHQGLTVDTYNCYTGVLELSPDGGGQRIIVPYASMKAWETRLVLWLGCYGMWPLRGY